MVSVAPPAVPVKPKVSVLKAVVGAPTKNEFNKTVLVVVVMEFDSTFNSAGTVIVTAQRELRPPENRNS